MSTADVLKNFNSISNRFSQNISIYYAPDVNKLVGISYFELNRVSDELSEYFSKIFRKNSRYIGVSLSEYFLLPCIILAIWKSGHYFAGLGTQYTRSDLVNFINFLSVEYIITDNKRNEYEGKLMSQFSVQQERFYVWCREIKTDEPVGLDMCCGIMTSGSTGEPKVIQVPWSCIMPNAVELAAEFQVNQHDCIFQASPYSFDPFFIELLMTFLSGCSLMIVSNVIKLSPSNLLKTLFGDDECDSLLSDSNQITDENSFQVNIEKVGRKNVTILQVTPSVFQRWCDRDIKNFILSATSKLRILIVGGEKFPQDILKLKSPGNKTRIFNIYGITEISCWAFLNEVTSNSPNSEISIGKPLKAIIYKISKNGELSIGSRERICLLNNEMSAQVENAVYRKTGDIVRLVNDEIHFIGRGDQVVKKFGIKINLSKIENCFLKENESIKECFCIFDNESLKLGLFYVPDNMKNKEINLRLVAHEEFCKNYKIPTDRIKKIEKPDYLIEISETPLNSHGKCDRRLLLKYLKDLQKTKPTGEDVEITFQKLWQEVLGVEKTNLFSLSFVELGGNSILGLNLINKLEDEGVRVPQNFITELLGQGNYEKCLNCLSLAQEKCGIPRKRIKFEAESSNVRLSLRWKFHLGKCVDATPVLFCFEGKERLVIGSHSSKLSCIDPDSGSEIWTKSLGDRIESGFKPTKDGTKGFVGCYDHHLYCIATSDGRVLWKFKTNDMVKSTPCLSTDEKVVFVASYDKNLYCLSSTEGKLIKSLRLSNGGIFCSGIVSDSLNSFFIGTLDGVCLSISQETNDPIWKTTLGSPIFSSPCLIPEKPEILFAEVLGIVHCLSTSNGDRMWTFKAEGNIYSSPTVRNLKGTHDILFGCHGAHLYCIQYGKEEPELKWKRQMDSPVFAKPLILFEYSWVCATTTKGYLYLCDLDEGSVKAQFKLDGEVFSSPVHQDEKLFVGCRDNNVYSLKMSTG